MQLAQDLPARVSRVQTWQERRYSDEDIIEALREVAPRVDKPVTFHEAYDEHRDQTHPSSVLITQLPGWSAALQKAGLTTRKAKSVYSNRRSDEQMLADIRCFLRQQPQGNSFDYEDWWPQQDDGVRSLSSVRKRFGTWGKALELAMSVQE